MPERIVYLMRGLPSCGKSTRARELAGEAGVICETDAFFYLQVGDSIESYDFDLDLMDEARQWNLQRFSEALQRTASPVVVDRGNGRNPETRQYITLAREHNYDVRLVEPDSPWWQELRVLLKYKQFVAPELFDKWADALADRSRSTHRVPAKTIRSWMNSWRGDLTVEEIMSD